jgi:hypothetical protein
MTGRGAGMTGGAGILTRGAIYKSHAVAVNCAGKSFFVFVCLEGFGVDQGYI